MGNASRNQKSKIKNQKFDMKLLGKFWPLLFIFLVWLLFSSPFFLSNKVPFPSTYQVSTFSPWSAYSQFAVPVKNSAMPDVIGQIYPWKKLVIESWKSGNVPLWNPYILSGTPLLADYQSAALSPFNTIFFLLPFIDAWSLLVLLQPLLAGLFMYYLARTFKISRIASLVASLSFMFSGFIVTWMSYATLGYAILFLPLSVLAIEKYFQTKSKRWLAVLSFSVPFSFFAGHFQISVYFLIITVSYIFLKIINNRREALICLLFVFFGVLLSMPQLLPSYELFSFSLRSNILQKSEIIPWQWIPTLIAPDFYGNPVTGNNWFGHYAEWNIFIGIIPLFLAVYAIFGKKDVRTFFLYLVAGISLLMAFDTPVAGLIYSLKIPVLSTSAAGRIICVYAFSASLLAAFGMDGFILDLKKRNFKKLFLIFSLFTFVFVISWSMLILKLGIPVDKISISKQNLIFPSLIWVLFSLVFMLSLFLKKRKFFILGILILFIIAIDLLRFAQKWQPFDPKSLVFPDVAVTAEFKKISGFNRVIGNLGGESVIYYHMPTVEGYDPLFIKRYGQLTASLSDGKIKDSERSVVKFPREGKFIWQGLNFLGVKYVVHKFSDGRNSWTLPFWEKPLQFKEIFNDGKYEIYENLDVLPRTSLIGSAEILSDDQKIMDFMLNSNQDLTKKIVLEKPNQSFSDGSIGSASILKYDPNRVEILVNATGSGYLMLTDSFYPGWKASVNGKPAEILRADYSFRALPVIKGKYVVKMFYEPESFWTGVYLSLLGIAGIFIFLVVPRILNRKASSFS